MNSSSSRRAASAAAALALCLSLPAVSSSLQLPLDGDAWVTMDAAVFATVTDLFAPGPGADVLPFLPRIAESRGVVITRLPESAVDALSERIHRDLHRCGGFVRHEDLAGALARLARLEQPAAELVLPFAIDRPDVVIPLVGTVDEATILATITSLSTSFPNRYRNHPAGTNAANAIKTMWEGYAAGRPDITVSLYSHPSITQPSVVLSIPGSSLPEEIVIVGAHEDSTAGGCGGNPNCTAPGADDDASGIATISEALRILLANDFHPQRTLQFMAFAGEEGGLIGSTDIAGDYAAAGAQVVAMLQQDMTAYKGSIEDVVVIQDAWTHAELNQFLGSLVDTYLPTLVRTTSACNYDCSDHASWSEVGAPASIAFESRFSQYNPFIHSPNDTVANFGGTAAHAVKFARLTLAFAIEASLDLPPEIFADDFEAGDTDLWSAILP